MPWVLRRVRGSLLAAGLIAACADDDPKPPHVCDATAPTECPTPIPTYADVQPIIERRCVTCHSDTSTGPWPLTTYQDVADWYDVVRDEVLRCTMPPPDSAEPLTSAESQAILAWIRCGFPR
jgi:uncharacterized membrane protein